MKKLQSLRNAVLSAPVSTGGGIDHERLLTFAEKGRVVCYDGGNGSFELSYDAHVIAVEFAGDPLRLLAAVCRWLETACPGTPPDAVKFHVDILDSAAADVSILVPVTETVLDLAPAGPTPVDDPDIATVDALLGLTYGG